MVYALAGGIASASDSTSDVNSRAVRCEPSSRPTSTTLPTRPILSPAVVLLHGAGDRAANMVDAWKFFKENSLAG
jgi:hypothetical protein